MSSTPIPILSPDDPRVIGRRNRRRVSAARKARGQAPRVKPSPADATSKLRAAVAFLSLMRLRTFARLGLVVIAGGYLPSLFGGEDVSPLVATAGIITVVALLLLVLFDRTERLPALAMVAATLPIIGAALTGFSLEAAPRSLALLLTREFAPSIFLVGLAFYVAISRNGAEGLRLSTAVGLLVSAWAASVGAGDLEGYILFLLVSPVLIITWFLLMIWTFSAWFFPAARTQEKTPRERGERA